MSTQAIYEAVKAYKEYQRMMEELESEMEAVKDTIKAELSRQGVDELTAGEYKVRWTAVKSSRFGAAAFRKAVPDLAEQFTRSVETKRFCVA